MYRFIKYALVCWHHCYIYYCEATLHKCYNMLHQCTGGALQTACSHCGRKHKLKVLCLAFCVSCHKEDVAAFPPNPVPAAAAAALCVFLLKSEKMNTSWTASMFWQNKLKQKWSYVVKNGGTGVKFCDSKVKNDP